MREPLDHISNHCYLPLRFQRKSLTVEISVEPASRHATHGRELLKREARSGTRITEPRRDISGCFRLVGVKTHDQTNIREEEAHSLEVLLQILCRLS